MERKQTYRRYLVKEITRLRNSRNGNPRYEVWLETISSGGGFYRLRARTPSDASWVYSDVLKPGAKIRGIVKLRRGHFMLTTIA